MVITTNNHRRELLALDQIPTDAAEVFDYITGEDRYSPRMVQYRGEWYDVNDVDGHAINVHIRGWDTYASDSFFSGLVFRYEDDYETVAVGTYTTLLKGR